MRQKITLAIFGMFFLASSFPLFLFREKQIVLYLNHLHTPILDSFAHFLTFIGSLWFYLIFLTTLFICRFNFKDLFFAGFSFFSTSIIVQVFKNIFFKTCIRPIGHLPLHEMYIAKNSFLSEASSSFPSGHSSTAFVLVSIIFFLFFSKKKFFSVYQISLLVLASFVALSRVYFCMHYYHDVYAGAFIGVAVTLAIDSLLKKISFPSCLNDSLLHYMIIYFQKKTGRNC